MKRLALLLLPLVLSACTALSPVQLEPISTYDLTKPANDKLFARHSGQTLLVSEPLSAAGYDSSYMLYQEKPFQLSRFSRHSWVAAPAKMLVPLMAESLRNSGYFKAVVIPPFAGLTDLRLDSHLIALYQDFTKRPSHVLLSMQVAVVDNNTNQLIATKRFSVWQQAPSDDPYGGVVAANQAATQLFSQVVRFTVHEARRLQHQNNTYK